MLSHSLLFDVFFFLSFFLKPCLFVMFNDVRAPCHYAGLESEQAAAGVALSYFSFF